MNANTTRYTSRVSNVLRSLLFWVVTQLFADVLEEPTGPISKGQGPRTDLKTRPIGFPEPLVKNYQHTLRDNPKERNHNLHCGRSLTFGD